MMSFGFFVFVFLRMISSGVVGARMVYIRNGDQWARFSSLTCIIIMSISEDRFISKIYHDPAGYASIQDVEGCQDY